MPEQLAYVIVTPYSLFKSRTGGILARLITRTGLDLVAAAVLGRVGHGMPPITVGFHFQ